MLTEVEMRCWPGDERHAKTESTGGVTPPGGR
jgi:hypothetical protein